jgi:hypothetical protein
MPVSIGVKEDSVAQKTTLFPVLLMRQDGGYINFMEQNSN